MGQITLASTILGSRTTIVFRLIKIQVTCVKFLRTQMTVHHWVMDNNFVNYHPNASYHKMSLSEHKFLLYVHCNFGNMTLTHLESRS